MRPPSAVGATLLSAWDAQQGWAEDGAVNASQWLRSFGEVDGGSHRLPAWCDVHHIIPWILFGPTDMDLLVLLCRRHHHLMHTKEPWVVHIDPTTRRPVFTRPNGQPARQPGLPPYRGGAPPSGTLPSGGPPGREPPDLIRAA